MEKLNIQDLYISMYEKLQEREQDHIGRPIPKTKEELKELTEYVKSFIDLALNDYLIDDYKGI